MLIICPECNKEISDKSKVCIHCGFPITEIEQDNICIIDGIPRDLTEQLKNLDNPSYKPYKKFGEWGLGIREADTLHRILEQTRSVPKEFNSMCTEKYRKELTKLKQDNIPKCPTCSSTNIKKISTTSKVTDTVVFGLFGTKRHKTFHCSKCGYEW